MRLLTYIVLLSFAVFFTGCGDDDSTAAPSAGTQTQAGDNTASGGDSTGTGDQTGQGTGGSNNINLVDPNCSTGGQYISPDPIEGLTDITASVDDCIEFRFITIAGAENLPPTTRYLWFRGTANIAERSRPRLRIDGLDADDGGVIRVVLDQDGDGINEIDYSATLTIQ